MFDEDQDDDEGEGDVLTLDNKTQLAVRATPPRLYDLSPALDDDPSQLGWPPTMVLELALKLGTPKSVCEDYGISREQWDQIRHNPHFIADLQRAVESLRTEGMAFKARAQLQSLELLKESWKLIHDVTTPANVRADLIKFTVRCSGLDASKDAALQTKAGPGFSITINMG